MNKRPKILLLEDDIDLGDSLKQFIEFEDFNVKLCRDGKSALATLAHENYQLYILDVMLPDISGFDVARQIVSKYPQCLLFF